MSSRQSLGPARNLGELLRSISLKASKALNSVEVSGITADSRLVGPGIVFVAVAGLRVDGHAYVTEAVTKGCAAVVVNQGFPGKKGKLSVPVIEVGDSRAVLGELAAAFWGNPADDMKMIGVTGTNGKTTTTYLLESIIREAGGEPGVIGTVNYRYGNVVTAAPFTTPEPWQLHKLLREMADAGVSHVVMEVSSHGLQQKRLMGVRFDVALFTNLSREHLDFHGDMESYYGAKKQLFTEYLKAVSHVVVLGSLTARSGEIDWGKRLAGELGLIPVRTGKPEKQFQGDPVCWHSGGAIGLADNVQDLSGTRAVMQTFRGPLPVVSSLVGDFNLSNIIGAVGVGLVLGMDSEAIHRGIGALHFVPGRLERIPSQRGSVLFVDYAHTPAAMEKVLSTLRRMSPGRLVLVFGCGGDRDRGKRPLMGQVAGRLADVILLTSDNPRGENPEDITAEIETGIKGTPVRRMRAESLLNHADWRGYDIVLSRRAAIRLAIGLAKPDDVVLISGKGHESYQITRDGMHFFDDRLEASRQLAVVGW